MFQLFWTLSGLYLKIDYYYDHFLLAMVPHKLDYIESFLLGFDSLDCLCIRADISLFRMPWNLYVFYGSSKSSKKSRSSNFMEPSKYSSSVSLRNLSKIGCMRHSSAVNRYFGLKHSIYFNRSTKSSSSS